MLIRIRHAKNRELFPDSLVFHFEEPGSGRRLGNLLRRVSGKKNGEEPEIILPIARGDQIFASLGPDKGRKFCLDFPDSLRSEIKLVISPLSSLGRNKNIPLKINSLIRDNQLHINYKALKLGKIPILYVSPESLVSRSLREDLHAIVAGAPVSCLLIDRAHCISEWGPDFRPSYLNIPRIIEDLKTQNPELTVMALTAVSGEMIRRDLLHFLKLRDISPPPAPGGFYRERISFQIIRARGTEGKKKAYAELMQRDVPRLLRDNGIFDYAPENIPPCSDPYACFGEGQKDQHMPGFPDISVSTDTKGKTETTHITVRLGMGDSPESWLHSTLGEGKNSQRIHAVRIADLPLSACEKDMGFRKSRIPSCSGNTCPFGNSELCDYGRQHHLIARMYPDTVTELMYAMHVLDRLLCSHAKRENPIRIPISSLAAAGGQKHAEKALYRLSLIRLTDRFAIDYREGEPLIKVYGFPGFLTEEAAMAGILAYLRRNDISANRKSAAFSPENLKSVSGEMQRYYELHRDLIFQEMEKAAAQKTWRCYFGHKELFCSVAKYLLPVICHVQDEMRGMVYRRLRHLKEFFRSPVCRYCFLLKHVQATDEEWKCGHCDRCAPDLRFDLSEVRAPAEIYALKEMEADFVTWLKDDTIPFEAAAADALMQKFGDFDDNMRIRCGNILEYRPRNIKALYIVRELCREEEKAMFSGDLMRVVSADMKAMQTIRLYETSRANPGLQKSLFQLLDDEYGALHGEEGEKWLYSEALRLAMPSRMTEMLKGRVMLNTLDKCDFRSRNTRLRQLLKEL